MTTFMLPVNRGRRWVVLVLVFLVQSVAMYSSYRPNPLAIVKMTEAPTPLQSSPLRDKPAVFLTASLQSYSVLVPLFHPASHWAQIAGQYNLPPGTAEWPRLQALLQSPLPMYLVVDAGPDALDAQGQLAGDRARRMQGILSNYGLSFSGVGCQVLISGLSSPSIIVSEETLGRQGFAVCALERGPGQSGSQVQGDPRKGAQPASAEEQALDAVEQHCPRFFPPGGGRGSLLPGVHDRHYAATDARLWVQRDGMVMYHYFRATDPTPLGKVSDILSGRFSLPCSKLPGRYVPFWQRP